MLKKGVCATEDKNKEANQQPVEPNIGVIRGAQVIFFEEKRHQQVYGTGQEEKRGNRAGGGEKTNQPQRDRPLSTPPPMPSCAAGRQIRFVAYPVRSNAETAS